MYGPGMWCVGSAPKQASCFRPDCVMPDRQRAQNRTFGFAPIPVIQTALTRSNKRTLPTATNCSHKGRTLLAK